MRVLVPLLALSSTIYGLSINPIGTRGRQFVDTVTNERFYIKGVDYQPGGSSAYVGNEDPLSNIESCARDIYLFQEMGVNAIRVYTVNPDVNHDECMSLLAEAGIYLILDVNSPIFGESLNRYEPWTTYTPMYLEHIFKVIEQFSGYNNTLAFFAGNEIINDERSAMYPHYIKAVVRDMKAYIAKNSPRTIPVGYSAADDLRYRKSLSNYLECGEANSTVDFYGVNSYQWCGEQTFQSSGYDTLVGDYKDYSLPLFLSEYGCNVVKPRQFQEILALYSPQMTPVFSGGLVYEFTMEPNGYGLVELDQQGSVYMTPEFNTVKERLTKVGNVGLTIPKRVERHATCQGAYENLMTFEPVPLSLAGDLIEKGVNVPKGKYITPPIIETSHRIYDQDGVEIMNKTIVPGGQHDSQQQAMSRDDRRKLRAKEVNGTETLSPRSSINSAKTFGTQLGTSLMAFSLALNLM